MAGAQLAERNALEGYWGSSRIEGRGRARAAGSEELWRLDQGSALLGPPFFQSISASAWGKYIPPESLIYRLLVSQSDTTVKGLLPHLQLQ